MEKEVFEKARNFMYRNARPLDLARFQYHFENSDKEAVMNVLSYYQNADGGCGHAVFTHSLKHDQSFKNQTSLCKLYVFSTILCKLCVSKYMFFR